MANIVNSSNLLWVHLLLHFQNLWTFGPFIHQCFLRLNNISSFSQRWKKAEEKNESLTKGTEILWYLTLNFTMPCASKRAIINNHLQVHARCLRTCAADSWLRWCHLFSQQTQSPDLRLHWHSLWPEALLISPFREDRGDGGGGLGAAVRIETGKGQGSRWHPICPSYVRAVIPTD